MAINALSRNTGKGQRHNSARLCQKVGRPASSDLEGSNNSSDGDKENNGSNVRHLALGDMRSITSEVIGKQKAVQATEFSQNRGTLCERESLPHLEQCVSDSPEPWIGIKKWRGNVDHLDSNTSVAPLRPHSSDTAQSNMRAWTQERQDFQQIRAKGRSSPASRGASFASRGRFARRGRYKEKGASSCRRSRSRSRDHAWEDWRQREASCDSEEEYRRSRSREKARRRKQYEVIRKYSRFSRGDYQVFWDGFQWVKKSEAEGSLVYDQQMNATRKARRLHIGNLPLFMDVTEDDFKMVLWNLMKERNVCSKTICPVLHVWFARDRGGNYGFVEMATVEDAHEAVRLDGFVWNGVPIKISRPTDWRRNLNDITIGSIAGTSGLVVAESLAVAAQQAASTGNSSGLISLVSRLSEAEQKAITEKIALNPVQENQRLELPMDLVQNQIRTELLVGPESRVLRILHPSSRDAEDSEDYADLLDDVMAECGKYGGIVRALEVNAKNQHLLPSEVEMGDIYLQFSSSHQVDSCILNLTGRLFDGKPIKMQRFDDKEWKSHYVAHSEDILMKKVGMGLAAIGN